MEPIAHRQRPPGPASISLLLSQISLLLSGRLAARLREAGLAEVVEPGMGPVLFALFDGPPEGLRLTTLADGLGIARSTMTAMAQRIEARELARVAPDPDDGRARRLQLTARGKRLRPRLERIREALDAELVEGVDPCDREPLAALLEQVRQQVRAPARSRKRRDASSSRSGGGRTPSRGA